jgi:nitrite reductase (NADH) large subunit
LQTSDPAIFAIGECAQHRGVTYGFVEPLWEQCTILAERLTRRRVVYAGSRVGTKLKVAGVNVVALGERDPRPGDEVITTLDSSGRYRRAVSRNGILVGAQVVGDAKAAAAFAHAFEGGMPIPGSLAAFIFGVEVIGTAAQPAVPNDERVCVCNEVSRGTIGTAIAGGAHDIAEIGRLTLAGTGAEHAAASSPRWSSLRNKLPRASATDPAHPSIGVSEQRRLRASAPS